MHSLIQDVDRFTVNVMCTGPWERATLDGWFEHW
jgi:hypothetical protein